MLIVLIIAFALIAAIAFAINAWHQVQIARLLKPTLDASTKWHESVANYSDILEAKVVRKAAAETAKMRDILAQAGYMVPASFDQQPVGDAPPAPNVRPESERAAPARQTGRLDEIHERRREVLRQHEEEVTTSARDVVSEPGVDV